MPTSKNFIAAMAKMFSKADSDTVRDLEDSLDIVTHSDQWSGDPSHGAKRRSSVGNNESASGYGATTMVGDYSKDIAQRGLAESYATFATSMDGRMDALEKAVTAVASLLSSAIKGVPFPKGEERFAAKADADNDDEEREDEEDEADHRQGD